jgi:hypothetical protein
MMDVHRRVEALTGVDVGSGDGGAQEDAEAADPVMGPAESLAAACNTNLQWGSACAVDAMPASAAGFHDVRGSAWEWCDDHFAALPGFKVRPSLSLSLHWLSLSLTVSPLALSLSHCLPTGSLSHCLSTGSLSLSLSLHWLSLSLTVSPLALSLSHCLSAWEWCDDHFAALLGFKVRPAPPTPPCCVGDAKGCESQRRAWHGETALNEDSSQNLAAYVYM